MKENEVWEMWENIFFSAYMVGEQRGERERERERELVWKRGNEEAVYQARRYSARFYFSERPRPLRNYDALYLSLRGGEGNEHRKIE